MSFLTRAVVYDHLICSGFKKNYSIWKDHGEVCKASSSRMMSEDEGLFSHDMDGLLGDLFPAAPLESREHMGESEINACPINSEPMDKNEKNKFNDLLKEAEQKIYIDAKHICLKDLTEDDLEFLESRVAVTLCKLEKLFPPSFFTVMVHLVIHLVREVRFGGPTPYRWMYPIERHQIHFGPGSIRTIICNSNLTAHNRKSSFNRKLMRVHLKQATPLRNLRVSSKDKTRKVRYSEFELEKFTAGANSVHGSKTGMFCNGDQNSLYSIPRTFDVPSLHRIDVDGDDGIDAAPNVEDEESEDEDDENS
ncbi:transposase-associated domain-containing protein [Tanacetum coccineum]|uniref:Transposase-associated domain-containing protein n=1 Tax=Tanacetum coccineum TaxID=301880 RepID=A0ABQ5A9Z7_9ASTR